jgi:hypothetical protein
MTIRTRKNLRRHPDRSRGTVILLVVAVLTLLAVLGTAYIVAAKAERGSSRASTDAENLDLAEDAALRQLQQLMWDQAPVAPWKTGWQYNVGDMVVSPFVPDTTVTGNNEVDGTYYWCSAAYTSAAGDTSGGRGGGQWTAHWIPTLRPRFFDYGENGLKGTSGTFGVSADYNSNTKIGTRDQPWLVGSTFYNSGDVNALSWITANGFDPKTGMFDIAPSATPQASTIIANGANDAVFWVADFSSASGVRYRYGVRVIDTNRMANLNTGNPNNGLSDTAGQYLTGVNLTANTIFAGEAKPLNLHSAPRPFGRLPGGTIQTLQDLYNWQNYYVLHLERPTDSNTSFFDLSDELELRINGVAGSQSVLPRPGAYNNGSNMWVKTLGPGVANRVCYAAYSFDRDLRRFADGANLGHIPYTLNGNTVWPVYPAKVSINAALHKGTAPNQIAVSVANPLATQADVTSMANDLATAATNVASAMELAGYNIDEARSAAANYLTLRYSGGYFEPTSDGVTQAYYLPAGPSFIDSQGICIRGFDPASKAGYLAWQSTYKPGDLAAAASKVYVGYVAQPFINGVGANMAIKTGDTTFEAPTNSAIELVNPYPVALSLNGFRLQIGGATHTFLATDYIPANIPGPGNPPPFFIVQQAAGWNVSSAPSVTDSSVTVDNTGANTVVSLQRQYFDRNGNPQWVTVDVFDYTNLVTITGVTVPTPATFYTLERPNSYGNYFDAAAEIPSVRVRAANNSTLGVANLSGTALSSVVVLDDRFAVASPPVQGAQLTSIRDLGMLLRDTNVIGTQTIGATTLTAQTITQVLAAVIGNTAPAPYSNMTPANVSHAYTGLPYDAQLHFNFYVPAAAYQAPPNTVAYDAKAVVFLDYLAWVDRVSDSTIGVNYPAGSTVTDLDKLRLPGRINVNTASSAVLQALPGVNLQIATNIVSYRDRTNAYANLPGKGIHSMAELLTPMNDAIPPAGVIRLYDWYATWAPIFTAGTVRSDTFVVYGYVEAIKPNALYTGVPNNAADWYVPFPAIINPSDTTLPNTLVARRRFIAIIDRSYSNYSRKDPMFRLPRIVALRDLPSY